MELKHIHCKKCKADLISIRRGVWECPRCGDEYSENELNSISGVNGSIQRIEGAQGKSKLAAVFIAALIFLIGIAVMVYILTMSVE